MSDLSKDLETPDNPRHKLGRLAELLDRHNIDVNDIGNIQKVSLYQTITKNEDGEAEVHDLTAIAFSPSWETGPEWPVVQQAKPTVVKTSVKPSSNRSEKVIFIAPDPQIGYRRYEDGTLDPFHDEVAINVSLQILRDAKPSMVINLGDTCDFPEWSSKFLVSPEFVMTTQPTIDRTHKYLAEQLAEAPIGCEVHMMEGNHDNRLPIAITKNAMAALRLRRANAPEEWPVLSLQALLRLDELGVKYHDGYPAGRVKLAHGGEHQTPLYAVHGERLTVSAVAKNERQSMVQGHIHRIQDHYETFEIDGEPVTVNAWSPGCLSRVDGSIPSTKGGTTITGRPVKRWENWQQGIGIITVMPDGSWSKEIVQIRNGRAIWRGNEYTAE